jgi:hypothetical protein
MDKPSPARNPVLIGALAAIAALFVVLLISGYLFFSTLGSYSQRVAAPIATVAAALATPADLPSPEPAYDPSITPVITPISGRPVVARRYVSLLLGPFKDAPLMSGSDGVPIMLAQGDGATLIATTDTGWLMLRLDSGAEGWVPLDAVQ